MRIFAIALGFAFGAPAAQAQHPGKIFRIGYVDTSSASGMAVLLHAFQQELTKLGWIEGKNVVIEYRFAEQKPERLPELAAELVRLKVDLIVASGIGPALAAKKATSTIPIVMPTAGDPVGAGLVASLARPGGNVTGLSALAPELNTKRLEILKDAIPKLSRVGLLLGSVSGIAMDIQLKELRPAALALKLKLEEIETSKLEGFGGCPANGAGETGGRDYDGDRSPDIRGTKANRRGRRQISIAWHLLPEGVCR